MFGSIVSKEGFYGGTRIRRGMQRGSEEYHRSRPSIIRLAGAVGMVAFGVEVDWMIWGDVRPVVENFAAGLITLFHDVLELCSNLLRHLWFSRSRLFSPVPLFNRSRCEIRTDL